MINSSNNQKGYIISLVTFFVLIIMTSMAVSIAFLATGSQKKITNEVKSTQSYFAAEAGIEDALFRLKKNPSLPPISYDMDVNGSAVSVDIPSTVGTSKSVKSQANNGGIFKTILMVCSVANTSDASFYYGVEVGKGGLEMSNGSRIIGNVFSAGNISGSGTIDNNVVVSGNGNNIDSVHVKGDVLAYGCLSNATVDGDLTYVADGPHSCTVHGQTDSQQSEISEQPMPIPDSQIDKWKTETATNSTSGDITIPNNQTMDFGPVKIVGSLTIGNNSTMNIKGTVYVTGNIILSNNAVIKLDGSYGSGGGVLISDGIINVINGTRFYGSGQPGSYLMVISTNSSNSAISISNNVNGAVFYTNKGGLHISNGVSLIEATGYKVIMDNNSTIQYSSGIVNIYFTSGPGGGWQVTSWQEQ